MPQNQSGPGNTRTASGKYIMSSDGAWDADRWAGVLVIGALGVLILLRMGFRGVSLMGARVSV